MLVSQDQAPVSRSYASKITAVPTTNPVMLRFGLDPKDLPRRKLVPEEAGRANELRKKELRPKYSLFAGEFVRLQNCCVYLRSVGL